ncbi:beta-glucosidase 46-like [Senna tora]|uniref:Beta-glucosidase 46-like n=1 Tax=Senna tora TaxID=362788 RepID=A0A834X8Y6_9FABA|nr:beta-glucosidase 46-like [Senna tora]
MGFSILAVKMKSAFLQLLISFSLLLSPCQSLSPQTFLFGTASSSYQFEGAPLADGKGLSNWDVFTHRSGGITDGSNADIAVDQYHRYLEDVDLMEDLNVNSYRFSISWARVLPKGRFGEVNMGGINYYNNLIDALLLKGIQPFVTLCHYDIPQELEDRYGSFVSHEFQFLEPLIFGRYPRVMEEHVGNMLPKFSSNEKVKLKRSLDFIGINHYASYYVKDCISSYCAPGQWVFRSHGTFDLRDDKDGVPLGETTSLVWLNVYPLGMINVINYLRDRYNNTPMYITENGFGDGVGQNTTNELNYYDFKRIDYMDAHLNAVLQTIRNGADVRGYFVWSLMDNFEWNDGYTVKFGLYHVNFTTQKRSPRSSASWYKNFIQKNSHNINKLAKLHQAA